MPCEGVADGLEQKITVTHDAASTRVVQTGIFLTTNFNKSLPAAGASWRDPDGLLLLQVTNLGVLPSRAHRGHQPGHRDHILAHHRRARLILVLRAKGAMKAGCEEPFRLLAAQRVLGAAGEAAAAHADVLRGARLYVCQLVGVLSVALEAPGARAHRRACPPLCT